jgi:hypothetical protein
MAFVRSRLVAAITCVNDQLPTTESPELSGL